MSESQEPNSRRIRFGNLKKTGTGALDPEALALAPRPDSDQQEDPPFPFERTIHWQPKVTEDDDEGEAAQGACPPVSFVVTQEVLLHVNEHVAQTLERELGGFLLGNRYRCPNSEKEYVVIDQYSPARFTESTDVNLAFTHEAWAHLREELDGKFRGKLLVGWYHSHPKMAVFLSNFDMKIQTERFNEPWMTALVIEPEKHHGGFFTWRNGSVNSREPSDFYEYLGRNSRETVLAWTNYTAVDSQTAQAPVVAAINTRTICEPREDEVNPETGEPVSAPEVRRTRLAKMMGHKAAPWIMVALASLLFISTVWGYKKLRQRPAAEILTQSVVVQPTDPYGPPPLKVDDESITYKLLPHDKLGVLLWVENPPQRIDATFNDQPADVDEVGEEGGRRRIMVTADLSGGLQAMRSNARQDFKVELQVMDGSDHEYGGSNISFFLERAQLFPNNAKQPVAGEIKVNKKDLKVVNKTPPRKRRETQQPATTQQSPSKQTAKEIQEINSIGVAGGPVFRDNLYQQAQPSGNGPSVTDAGDAPSHPVRQGPPPAQGGGSHDTDANPNRGGGPPPRPRVIETLEEREAREEREEKEERRVQREADQRRREEKRERERLEKVARDAEKKAEKEKKKRDEAERKRADAERKRADAERKLRANSRRN